MGVDTFLIGKGNGTQNPLSGHGGNIRTTTVIVSHKGMTAKCATPGFKRHQPLYTLDARSRAYEAEFSSLWQVPFVSMSWRHGSGPIAAELPATAAKLSQHGPVMAGGFALRLLAFSCALVRRPS